MRDGPEEPPTPYMGQGGNAVGSARRANAADVGYASDPHGDLKGHIGRFVDYYSHRRYHESLQNLTPPMSTSDAAKPSCFNARGSSET